MVVKLKSPDAWFIQVDVQFATEYGLNEAIVAGKLLRLLTVLAGTLDDAGNKWIRLTLGEWQRELPFMSDMTIRRTIESLERKTIVLTRTFTGRPKWYRLNPAFVDDSVSVQNEQIAPKVKLSVQNEQLVSVQNEQINCSKRTDASVQNEQLPRVLPISLSKSEKAHTEKVLSDNRPFAIRLAQLGGYDDPQFIINGRLTELAQAVTQLLAWGATIADLDSFARWWWGKTPPTFRQVVDEWGKFKAAGGQPETGNGYTPPSLDDTKRAAYLALQAETERAQAESAARVAAVMTGGIKAAGIDVQKEIKKVQRRLK